MILAYQVFHGRDGWWELEDSGSVRLPDVFDMDFFRAQLFAARPKDLTDGVLFIYRLVPANPPPEIPARATTLNP